MGESLWILEGASGGRAFRFDLEAGVHVVGREQGVDLRLTDPSASRRHAQLSVSAESVEVSDLGSRNGTWVNGRRIEGSVLVGDGDGLRFGGVDSVLRRSSRGQGGDESGRVPLLRSADPYLSAADNLSTSLRLPAISPGAGEEALSASERRLLQAVFEAGPLLVGERPLKSVFESVLDLVTRVVPSRRVLLLLQEEEDGEPQVRAARPPLAPGQKLMLSQGLVNEVLEKRESLLVTDATLDERFRDRGSIMAQEVRAALVAPLFDNERVIGLVYLDSSDPSVVYGSDQLRTLTLLANLVAVKITTTRLQESQREKERMEQELATAVRIQTSLLPARLPELDGYELCAHQTPCLEVGGDLYDVLALDDGRLALVVGDVTGKGMGAALLMSNVLAGLRVLLEQKAPILEVAVRINRQLVRYTDPIHFATLFLGILDPQTHRFDYVNAGHNPPLMFSSDGGERQLDSTGLPFGMIDGPPYTVGVTEFASGDLICVFSDGITEAESEGEFYGEERLGKVLLRGATQPLPELTQTVLESVREFLKGGRPADDVTLLLARRSS